MYGDTAVVRRRSGQLREQSVELRALADRLVAEVEALDWRGRAATDLAERVRDRAGHLRSCAEQHDEAADLLDRHGHEVDRLQDLIATTEQRAARLLADGSVDDFGAPPPGHRDWLAVTLPGG